MHAQCIDEFTRTSSEHLYTSMYHNKHVLLLKCTPIIFKWVYSYWNLINGMLTPTCLKKCYLHFHRKTQLLQVTRQILLLIQETFLPFCPNSYFCLWYSVTWVNTVPKCNPVCRFPYNILKICFFPAKISGTSVLLMQAFNIYLVKLL